MSSMKRLLAVMAMCALLLASVKVAPALYESVHNRIMLSRYSSLILTEARGERFMQLLVNYFVNNVINNGFAASAASRIGAKEKAISAMKELMEAQLAQDSAHSVNDAVAESSTTFSMAEVKRTCIVMSDEKDLVNAEVNAHIFHKTAMAAAAVDSADTPDTSASRNSLLQSYKEKYCSQDAVDRGRCTKLSNQPDASITASTLLIPEEGETLSSAQRDAAKDFMNMVIDPAPEPDVPKALEQTPAGQRFLLEKQALSASLSMSRQAYIRAMAARTSGVPRDN